MSISFNGIQKSQLLRSHYFFSFSTLLRLIFVLASIFFALAFHSKSMRALSSFSFTAASDYGQTNYTTANLSYIAHSGASFNLALGDLNYDPTHVSASAWSSYVKSHLPSSFPFELIAGNHDTSQLSALAVDLPDHIGNISGAYAREYYFDYPPSAPLARFIMISPGGVAGGYSYSKGSSHYNWLSQKIDSARAANIHWVIVAMHEHCIVAGSQACTIGSALEDLLVSKKVDLILQGHKRSYQASKQLAINGTTCKTIQVNGYNPNCVVNATTLLTRGAGSVIVITGTGGQTPLGSIDSADPEKGYFRMWMGSNVNQTWGVSKFTVSATQLHVQFVGVSGGFSDNFTISG